MQTASGRYAVTVDGPDDVDLSQFGYRQELRRTLGLRDLLTYGLIFMVPIAPFGIFGGVFAASGGMVALAYAVGMVAMVFTAVSYAQMVRAFPMAGSVYNYAGRGIGAPVGFLAGWAVLLDYVLVPGLLSLIAAVAMNATVPAVPVWVWIAGFVGLNTVVNLFGIRMTAMVTRWFLAGELAVLAVFLYFAVRALLDGKAGGFSLGRVLDPLYNAEMFSWPVVFAAVSVAMLSFLGFDGISMLAEENRGGAGQIGRAMIAALGVAGALFVAQTWMAALLVPDPGKLLAEGDPGGTAFYDAAEAAGGAWLATLTAVATALAWGVANSLVAQVATSRLLFAMARDRQLPGFLSRVSVRHAVPVNAVVLVAVVSLGLGLYMASRDDGIALLAGLINFGAVLAFVTLHVAVVWHYVVRHRSRNLLAHLVCPLVGGGLLVAVAIHANVLAQRVGLIWLGGGVLVLAGLWLSGRRPTLSGLSSGERS